MYGAMLQGIGAGTSALGGIASAIGNRNFQKKQNKAQKIYDQILLQGLQNSVNEFKRGSTDTQGNTVRYKNGNWGYDLSNSGKADVANANRQSHLANAMSANLPSTSRNQLTAQDYLSQQRQANANQAAANRNALRTGSNLGDISRSYGQAGNSYLQQAMAQNMRNGQQTQLQNIQNYLTNAANAKALTQSTQQNLMNMQNNLALPTMNQNNMITQAQASAAMPKVNQNYLQLGGKMLQGTGQTLSNLGGQVQKAEQAAQNQQLLQQLLSKASQTRDNGGGNTMDFSALLKLLPMLMSGAG